MPLRKTIFISILGHLLILSIFSFSFGRKIPKIDYPCIFSLAVGLKRLENFNPYPIRPLWIKESNNILLLNNKVNQKYFTLPRLPLKPAVIPVNPNKEKINFIPELSSLKCAFLRKKSVLEFHPLLPQTFRIYFKDREKVHIELLFNIIASNKTPTLVVKRKISSGNLEADLLVMRYLRPYLFLKQSMFSPNKWQTLKIDLSLKNN